MIIKIIMNEVTIATDVLVAFQPSNIYYHR